MANRTELEAQAVELGLVGASTYKNKMVVEDAIKRVSEGKEDAAVVDAELTIVADETSDENTEAGTTAPVQTTDDETVEQETGDHQNQGHPTTFTNTGAPKYL